MEQSPAAKGETLVRMTGEHWIKYVWISAISLFLIVFSIALLLAAGLSAPSSMWLSHGTFLGGLLLLTLTHHWLFIVLLSEYHDRIIITSKRIIHMQSNLFVEDRIREIPYDKVRAVEAENKGFLQTILRYGRVNLIPAGSIDTVPHPGSVARDVQQAMGMR